MKYLAIALLLANVGLVAWQYQTHVRELAQSSVEHEPIPADAAPLKLISELPALPEPRVARNAAQPPAVTADVNTDVVAADLCMDIGPFGDVPSRDAVRDWLRDYAAATYMRVETVRKRQFFWVYLEPSSDSAAQKNLAELHDRGIHDTLLIRRGDMKNSISLGFFRSQDSVNRRLAELNEKGYKPVVVPRFETSDLYWLSARLAEQNAEAPEVPATLLGSTAKQRTIACEAMATDGQDPAAATTEAKADRPMVEGLTD
ncbi:MAG: SPOR domain-containing protein [Proteobacteria bacterium]|jgi:hypothetical protein|nr:SPOR domain-containing protein [Pseudomonadota bacterium]